MKPLRSGRILLRTFVAIGLVGGLAVVTYLLLVPFVLVGTDEYRGSLAVGLLGGVTTIGLLGLQALRLAPALSRLTNSVRSGEIPDPFDREKIYAAPRRAAGLMVVMGLVILASGYVPLGGPLGQERTLCDKCGSRVRRARGWGSGTPPFDTLLSSTRRGASRRSVRSSRSRRQPNDAR